MLLKIQEVPGANLHIAAAKQDCSMIFGFRRFDLVLAVSHGMRLGSTVRQL